MALLSVILALDFRDESPGADSCVRTHLLEGVAVFARSHARPWPSSIRGRRVHALLRCHGC